MTEHTRRSPYEPESNDGSERNSRQDPAEVRAAAEAEAEAPAEPEVVADDEGEDGSDE